MLLWLRHEFCTHGQAHHPFSQLLGHRRAVWAAEVFVSRLLVQRHGVVHRGGNARFGQELLQRFALGHHDGILGIDAGALWPLLNSCNTCLVE